MRQIAVFVLIISVFLLLSVPSPQPSWAQAALSPGCTELNNSVYDGLDWSGGTVALDFYAGETVTAAADYPITGSGPPTSLTLYVVGTLVDEALNSFPDTLTYTFAVDTHGAVRWYSYIQSTGEHIGVTWTVSCTVGSEPPPAPKPPAAEGAAAPVIVPGCDAVMNIPDTAVVGTFVETVVADWAPGEVTAPSVTLEAGKTAWVLGVDESGAYYKIFWGCQTLWVPVGTIGPNHDDVWHGTPLPTEVVS